MRISDWSSECSSDLLVEPDLGGRIQCVAFSVLMAFFEEQKVRLDSGIRIEDAVRQADDGVQVALRHQLLLDARLDAFAKECAIRQDYRGAAAFFPKLDNQHQDKVRFPPPLATGR